MSAKLIIASCPPDKNKITKQLSDALNDCDVILYDRLIDANILDGVRAKKVFVGKQPYKKHPTQESINDMIKMYLKKGLRVVRLKGGDAAFFSRATEEIAVAKQLNAEVCWIAGITSASLLCERLKTSLTVRGVSNGVIFITGHTKDNKIEEEYDWDAIVRLNMTLVIYMGIKNLPLISQLLMDKGMDPKTPVAVGMNLGFDDERVEFFYLKELKTEGINLKPPAIVVIGDVLKYSLKD
ncbi:uroporphyrinogen-III C-methyltransferase [Hippea maritima]|uniref:uroporphyrinogen-III C-methyltransferase n=1 Tax=Hippea maritima (strain ATCC 700847 / DSM 10411 / MH2) TaxID=760142 RepID=F2LU95_HIPMA|nr:uroporphyrinogen-III C-methyltransferase [Hippea maritima]AEA34558.1 Uroporphyrinogen-III C-methyltransferase [Hippea maritima DSM 10411]